MTIGSSRSASADWQRRTTQRGRIPSLRSPWLKPSSEITWSSRTTCLVLCDCMTAPRRTTSELPSCWSGKMPQVHAGSGGSKRLCGSGAPACSNGRSAVVRPEPRNVFRLRRYRDSLRSPHSARRLCARWMSRRDADSKAENGVWGEPTRGESKTVWPSGDTGKRAALDGLGLSPRGGGGHPFFPFPEGIR